MKNALFHPGGHNGTACQSLQFQTNSQCTQSSDQTYVPSARTHVSKNLARSHERAKGSSRFKKEQPRFQFSMKFLNTQGSVTHARMLSPWYASPLTVQATGRPTGRAPAKRCGQLCLGHKDWATPLPVRFPSRLHHILGIDFEVQGWLRDRLREQLVQANDCKQTSNQSRR
jgi:hypothetical protein